MKISEYIKEYTSGDPIEFHSIIMEIDEMVAEIIKMNRSGIIEEFEDVFHFLQLWLHSRFGIDGEIWKITRHSVKKFMDRKYVWNQIYVSVGLSENISGYVGNYRKIEKVVKHLQRFGIEKEKAEESYRKIVESNQWL